MHRRGARAKGGVAICALLLALLAVAAARRGGGGAADGALIGKADFAHLESHAKDLAAKGCAAETAVVLDVLVRVGDDGAALAKTRDACSKSLAKTKTPAAGAAVASLAHSIHGTAGDLCKQLAALGVKDSTTLAEEILRLDDDQPLAHEALGQTFEKAADPSSKSKGDPKAGAWLTPEQQRVLARRRDINAAILKARKLEIPLEVGVSDFAPLRALDPSPMTVVRFGDLQFHSTMGPEQLQRVVRRGLQALALSKFLRGLDVDVPATLRKTKRTYVMLTSKALYDHAIDVAVAAKGILPADAAASRAQGGYIDRRGFYLENSLSEVENYCFLVLVLGQTYFYDDDPPPQPCLIKGHLNWLCLSFFGSALPGIVFNPKLEVRRGDATTSDRAQDALEEKRAQEVADAGISGARRWMVFKAARGEDPPWANSFVDDIAQLVDFDLVKSTFVVEYLQELSTFDELLHKTAMKSGDKRSRKEQIEARFEGGLPAFEARFHAWLLPREAAVVQRLAKPPAPAEKTTKDEQAALAALDRVRRATWDVALYGEFEPMQIDRELSTSCGAHAHYLRLHPAQLEKWPDAHEEYPDQEGFSSEGCWAGMHSVIAPGVAGADEAVAGWMGTFYHRLPLLEPGLKRIGYAFEERVAVLDSDSLVVPDKYEGCVLWPARDLKDVPTRFTPGGELPHPVPGVDEREFGYPITLQTTRKNVEIELVLTKGPKRDGPVVPGHVSTPAHPTNPDLAPTGAFGLLPKARLEPRTTYTVTARFADGAASLVWSFTTGE
jgi:hypothetical protein